MCFGAGGGGAGCACGWGAGVSVFPTRDVLPWVALPPLAEAVAVALPVVRLTGQVTGPVALVQITMIFTSWMDVSAVAVADPPGPPLTLPLLDELFVELLASVSCLLLPG